MTKLLVFFALAAFTLTCRGAEQQVLDGTLSPDKRTAIVQEQDEDGSRVYYFARFSNHKKLGYVLPDDQRDQISNVSLVASWNASSTKVALLMYYGTRGSALLLFSKNAAGQFQEVTWQHPDAEAIYHRRTGRVISHLGNGYTENAVGPWVDENTVRLISGQATEIKDTGHHTHFLATFKARVRGKRGFVSGLQLKGPFSDETDEELLKKWGGRY